mgnify:FL=1
MKLFLLAALAGALSFAQDISGTIAGNVIDPSGGAVPNAKVTVTNTDKGQVIRTLTTDSGGNYVAALLPVGTYSIKVEASGFAAEALTGIAVNVNDDIKLNISLSVGTAATR